MAELGSLAHFRNQGSPRDKKEDDVASTPSSASTTKRKVKNLQDLQKNLKQRKYEKKMAKILRDKLQKVQDSSMEYSLANSSDMY